MSRKPICIITGTRAEYGLLKPLIAKVQESRILELQLVVTGAHLSPDFGETYLEIENDGNLIHERIKLPLETDTHAGMAKATGTAIIMFTDYFETHRPDMVVILGDRYEIFGASIAAAMLNVPIAHISGGDTTQGAVDEFIRHSITKMSYLHFPTNEESRQRIIQLGESPERVFNVGALNIDNIRSYQLLPREELSKKLGIDLSGQYVLVTFHPVTMNDDEDITEFEVLLKAIECFTDIIFLFTKANADAGGRAINKRIDEYVNSKSNCIAFDSLGSICYLSAMKHSCMVIGNSSSGLYETPSFAVPCINIGDRQRGRMRAENVIDCEAKSGAIEIAMRRALSTEFREIAEKVVSPFGDGHAADRIISVIDKFLSADVIDLKKSFHVTDVAK